MQYFTKGSGIKQTSLQTQESKLIAYLLMHEQIKGTSDALGKHLGSMHLLCQDNNKVFT